MSQDLLILAAQAKKIRLLETRISLIEKKLSELIVSESSEEIPKKIQRKKE